MLQLQSFLGILIFIGVAYAMSNYRKAVSFSFDFIGDGPTAYFGNYGSRRPSDWHSRFFCPIL